MDPTLRLEELVRAYEEARRRGRLASPEDLCRDCPDLLDELRRRLGGEGNTPQQATVPLPRSDAEPATVTAEAAGASSGLAPGLEPVPGYRLARPIGRGGFGEVWEVAAPGGFRVAFKFVEAEGRAGAAESQALQIIRNLRHPNLLTVFATWRTDRWIIIGMELADKTLSHCLDEVLGRGEAGLPRRPLVRYAQDTAKVLDFLNKPRHFLGGPKPTGIQHGDIKPQNILLLGEGVKVGDFGLMRLLARAVDRHAGGMTPQYAAPEVFEGRISRWSDQYALAVTWCQLRGGRLPFAGPPAAVAAGHLYAEPDLSALPEEERPVVARALSKDPRHRWPNCRAFIKALADCRATPAALGAAPPPAAPASRRALGRKQPPAPGGAASTVTGSAEHPVRLARSRSSAFGLKMLLAFAAGTLLVVGGTITLSLMHRLPASALAKSRPPGAVQLDRGVAADRDVPRPAPPQPKVAVVTIGRMPEPEPIRVRARPTEAAAPQASPGVVSTLVGMQGSPSGVWPVLAVSTLDAWGGPPHRAMPIAVRPPLPTSPFLVGGGVGLLTSPQGPAALAAAPLFVLAADPDALFAGVPPAPGWPGAPGLPAPAPGQPPSQPPPLTTPSAVTAHPGWEWTEPFVLVALGLLAALLLCLILLRRTKRRRTPPAPVAPSFGAARIPGSPAPGSSGEVLGTLGTPMQRTLGRKGEPGAIHDKLSRVRAPRGPGAGPEYVGTHDDAAWCVAVEPAGCRGLSGGMDGAVYLWELETHRELRRLSGHADGVTAVLFTRDGSHAVSAGLDGVLRAWALETGEEVRRFEGHQGRVLAAGLLDGGRLIVSGGEDRTVRVWEAATGRQLRQLDGHPGPVTALAASTDGRRLLSAGDDGILRLWDAEGRELRRLTGHTGSVRALVFSPDGKLALSGGEDRDARLWDVETGRELRRLSGHADWIRAVAFAPDGRRLVTGGDDETLCVWDAATGERTQQMEAGQVSVLAAAYTPDGRAVLAGCEDGTVVLFRVS
jgi:hypothetical protein